MKKVVPSCVCETSFLLHMNQYYFVNKLRMDRMNVKVLRFTFHQSTMFVVFVLQSKIRSDEPLSRFESSCYDIYFSIIGHHTT